MEQLKVDFNKVIESLKLSEKSINSRKENLNQFVENGFPNKRVEDWKFSDLNQIISSNIENLLDLEIEERAHKGIFLAFQYPLEIPGVNTNIFLKTSLNAIKKAKGEKELDAIEFLKLVKQKASELKFDEKILSRQLNVGFSGGEKKKNEILQMSILNPRLSILDETDSGLDIDALKIVSEGVNALRSKESSFLIITHYQRLLEYIKPDFVHVLINGQIVKSGGSELALELENKGYESLS